MSASRLAVAGIGLCSPLGDDVGAAWDRLCAGDSGIVLRTFDGLPAIPAAVVPSDVAGVLGRLQQVGTERVSQMALGAARRALEDAGLVPGEWRDPERVGLYVGTGMGGAATIDAGYAALHGGRSLPPMTVPAGMVNGAAGVVAMHLGIRGPA